MTIDERSRQKKLYDITKENNKGSDPDSKDYLFLVRGPLWDQKVIKMRKRREYHQQRKL